MTDGGAVKAAPPFAFEASPDRRIIKRPTTLAGDAGGFDVHTPRTLR
ncbi:hypothetical protein [Oceanicaulis sp. MMSF_3324]|nr:hypothetical protein [Oceanicaulis sp. MMSF_3324]